MLTLLAYRSQFMRIAEDVTDAGTATDEQVEAVRSLLTRSPFRFDDLLERLANDPDLARVDKQHRVTALTDYIGIAVGLIDRALEEDGVAPATEPTDR
jgi:hypothetical protein